MPARLIQSGFSSLRSSQLKTAPKTGIKNFQKFSSETLTPGFFRSTNHIEKADADRKESQSKLRTNGKWAGQRGTPSTNKEITVNITPPRNSCKAFNRNGSNCSLSFDTKMFPSAEQRVPNRSSIIPTNSNHPAGTQGFATHTNQDNSKNS